MQTKDLSQVQMKEAIGKLGKLDRPDKINFIYTVYEKKCTGVLKNTKRPGRLIY